MSEPNRTENIYLKDVLKHIQTKLKEHPKLTVYTWDKEYQPYIELLEKIAQGEMNQ